VGIFARNEPGGNVVLPRMKLETLTHDPPPNLPEARVPAERISDAERERAVELLGAHVVSGSLTPDELVERTEAVLTARTRGELRYALRDLPALPRPPLLVRAAELVPLRAHVIAYVAVSVVLVAVWAATRERDPRPTDEGFGLLWPFWIMLIWAVPLVAQALYVLRRPLLRRVGRHRRDTTS
jgi:hypothetical protein